MKAVMLGNVHRLPKPTQKVNRNIVGNVGYAWNAYLPLMKKLEYLMECATGVRGGSTYLKMETD